MRSLYQLNGIGVFLHKKQLIKAEMCAALVIKKNLIARRKHMKPEHVKKLLLTEIKNVADNPQDY